MLSIPLGIVVQRLLTDRALDALEAEVTIVADVLDDGTRDDLATLLELTSGGGLGFAVFSSNGVLVSPTVEGSEALAPGDLPQRAVDEQRVQARRGGLLQVATVVSRGRGGDLVVYGQRSDEALRLAVRRTWLLLGAILLGVLTVGAVAATVLGDRFGRPLDRLAAAAGRLGDGDFTSRAPRSGLEEVDAIAEALDATADRLGAAVARGQAFAGDASHQLRTPLTALRLHLETLEALLAAPGGQQGPASPLDDALAEVDRLEATIAELVSLTELGGAAPPLDLRGLAEERLVAVRTRAVAADRELVLLASETAPVAARRSAVGQALDVLLDNALDHGAGRVTVLVGPSARGARLAVHDEGGDLPPDVAARVNATEGRDRTGAGRLRRAPLTGGRGLLLARALVEAEGGRLRADEQGGDVGPGTLLSLLLPTTPDTATAVRTTTNGHADG